MTRTVTVHWASTKVGELRAALSLDERVPVYVVCQDFAQMAGTERNPDSAVWDESRSWDGISGTGIGAITALGSSPRPDIRQAAAQRFWGSSVQQRSSVARGVRNAPGERGR